MAEVPSPQPEVKTIPLGLTPFLPLSVKSRTRGLRCGRQRGNAIDASVSSDCLARIQYAMRIEGKFDPTEQRTLGFSEHGAQVSLLQ